MSLLRTIVGTWDSIAITVGLVAGFLYAGCNILSLLFASAASHHSRGWRALGATALVVVVGFTSAMGIGSLFAVETWQLHVVMPLVLFSLAGSSVYGWRSGRRARLA